MYSQPADYLNTFETVTTSINKILPLQENQQNSLILTSAIRNKNIVIRKHSFPCKIIGNNQDIDQILQLTEMYYLSC